MRLQRIGFAAVLLVSMAFISSCPTTTAPVYERIVIETYKYDETAANVDTYLRLYDSAGTLLAENDNISMGNLFSWIDYQKGLGPGTYYIKIDSEATPFPNIGPYVIRALSLKLGEAIPDYIYPGSPAIEAYPDGDDDPATGDMTTPKDLPLGTYLNRYLTTSPDHVPPPYEVDWCKLELP